MKILGANSFKTTSWAGGTTTELFIYPPESSYAERNFIFRISTATVEAETSDFTPLPGVKRTLMLLSGKMELKHEHHHSAILLPFEVDDFSGDWKTQSIGKCVDLNLMCRGNAEGKLIHHSLAENDKGLFELNGEMNFIYVISGRLFFGEHVIECGTLIVKENPGVIGVISKNASDIVLIELIHL